MKHQYWDELDLLAQKITLSKRLLGRAEEFGDQRGANGFRAELNTLNRRRENIILSIASFSVAA